MILSYYCCINSESPQLRPFSQKNNIKSTLFPSKYIYIYVKGPSPSLSPLAHHIRNDSTYQSIVGGMYQLTADGEQGRGGKRSGARIAKTLWKALGILKNARSANYYHTAEVAGKCGRQDTYISCCTATTAVALLLRTQRPKDLPKAQRVTNSCSTWAFYNSAHPSIFRLQDLEKQTKKKHDPYYLHVAHSINSIHQLCSWNKQKQKKRATAVSMDQTKISFLYIDPIYE